MIIKRKEKTMKTIKLLLATDCSEGVMNAERYAVQFAIGIGAHLTVLHVYEAPLSSAMAVFDPEKTEEDPGSSELKNIRERMGQLIRSMGALTDGLDFECVVREGDTATQIREEAKESGTDLIITGTHDSGKFRELFLGSHTWEVMKKTEIPVLAIPQDAHYEPIRHLVFATEYRAEELPVIQSLVELAKRMDASFTVVHMSNYSLSKPVEAMLFEQFRHELRAMVSYEKMKISLIHHEDLVEGLNNFCMAREADWLAVCSGKSKLSDVLFNPGPRLSRRLSFHTRMPLLVIPDEYQLAEWGLLEFVEKQQKNE
jgi:nucleotide-binding universal stress UspA family protein